jgi:poly(3-hydroxybutyrate) depolymerase
MWTRLRAAWNRLTQWLRARLFRREILPGRFESGRATSRRGIVATAPLVPPARDYLVYVPRGYSRWRRAPLVVMCHGCRQTPEAFAGLAGIAAHADREGWLVLLPRQAEAANRYGCWNWFESGTANGAGEAAILAAQIVDVRRRYRARRERVWVVGLSAGGALAAVMGLRHPRLVRGVMAHSGLACGAASSVATAFAVMAHGPDNDVARFAEGARATQRGESVVPLLVVQGDRDDVVAPMNGVALVVQYLRFNGHPAGETGYKPAAALPRSDASAREAVTGRHPVRIDEWTRAGHVVVRHVTVEGLGHAWSGGDDRQPFADPRGPDALALFARFAAEAAA